MAGNRDAHSRRGYSPWSLRDWPGGHLPGHHLPPLKQGTRLWRDPFGAGLNPCIPRPLLRSRHKDGQTFSGYARRGRAGVSRARNSDAWAALRPGLLVAWRCACGYAVATSVLCQVWALLAGGLIACGLPVWFPYAFTCRPYPFALVPAARVKASPTSSPGHRRYAPALRLAGVPLLPARYGMAGTARHTELTGAGLKTSRFTYQQERATPCRAQTFRQIRLQNLPGQGLSSLNTRCLRCGPARWWMVIVRG